VLIGPRTPEQLDQLLLCADIALSPDTLAAIDHVVPPGRDVDPTNFVVVR
jgi:aryl-alcohol dehydrogenase-like predicted oxidoreductase